MKISIIAAIAENGIIGNVGKLPWHIPNDLKHFKKITEGHPVIMGRKTYESLGKPLPNRTNFILTNNKDFKVPNECFTCCSLSTVINTSIKYGKDEVFIIGGVALYREAIQFADNLYITHINKSFHGDTVFPIYPVNKWEEVSREDIIDDPTVDFTYSFVKYSNKFI